MRQATHVTGIRRARYTGLDKTAWTRRRRGTRQAI